MTTEQASRTYTQAEVDEIVGKAIKQDRELTAQVMRSLPQLDYQTKQRLIEKPAILRGLLQSVAPNAHIRVNRLRPVECPKHLGQLMLPDLQAVGLSGYDLATDISLWSHKHQKSGLVSASVIFDELREKHLLERCLTIQDAEAITEIAVEKFHLLFGKKKLYFWKSILQGDSWGPWVPYLYADGYNLRVDWQPLGRHTYLNVDEFAAMFAR